MGRMGRHYCFGTTALVLVALSICIAAQDPCMSLHRIATAGAIERYMYT
jgi:hypothetical protein